MFGQHHIRKKDKGVEDTCEASNLRKEKTLLVLWKVLRRKEADEDISFILEGHNGTPKYKYLAVAEDPRSEKKT